MEVELWLVYVLIAALFRGGASFITKIISYKNLDSSSIFQIQMFLASLILIFFINKDSLILLYKTPILIYTFLIGMTLFFFKKNTVQVLKDISSSIAFISTRIFPTLLLLIASFILFQKALTIKELIGLLLGILTFVFLYDKTDTAKKDSNFFRGIQRLIVNILLGTFMIIFIKYSILIDINLTLFLYSFFCFCFFFGESISQKSINFSKLTSNQNLSYGFLLGIGFCIANYFLFKALKIANTAVVYKIFSYEIFVPIILSILFFNEKITIRKSIAFILTILSLFFFF